MMLQTLFGIPLVCLGIYALTCVRVPSWRACWKGTRVRTGAVSNLGLGLTFVAAGTILILARDTQDQIVLAIGGPPLLAGVLLILLGNWLDFRQPKHGPLPDRKRRTTSRRA